MKYQSGVIYTLNITQNNLVKEDNMKRQKMITITITSGAIAVIAILVLILFTQSYLKAEQGLSRKKAIKRDMTNTVPEKRYWNGNFNQNQAIYRSGSVGIGITNENLIGTLHIKDRGRTDPAIFITDALANEGDIAVSKGESFEIGQWDIHSKRFYNMFNIEADGKIVMGSSFSAPRRYNFKAAALEVRTAHNPSNGPVYAARFSNAAGSGSGVIIQAGFKHKSNKSIEVLRLAPFDGPAQFVFFNDGRSIGLSDKRLKKEIKPIKGALDKIDKVKGVTFKWHDSEQIHMGLIAQDVEKAFPKLVSNIDGYKGIDYSRFTAVLAECVKELKSQVTQLRLENKQLREIIESKLND